MNSGECVHPHVPRRSTTKPLSCGVPACFFRKLDKNSIFFGIAIFRIHWEIKGRFRKRVVLANVPSFRFSFRGNIRRNHPFGNHPLVNTKKGHWEIKGRFRKRVVLANVPSFRFSSRGNIRQNHPFGNHPLVNPRRMWFAWMTVRLRHSEHVLWTDSRWGGVREPGGL